MLIAPSPAFLTAMLAVLTLHGVLGAVDVLINHEFLARVPQRKEAHREQRLHAARELVFATVFAALAWAEWRGQSIWFIAALLAIELCITVVDTVVEVEIRKLPVFERINHVLLLANFGVLCLLTGLVLRDWSALPTAVVPAHHGPFSIVLSLLAISAFLWSIRDYCAARRLSAMDR